MTAAADPDARPPRNLEQILDLEIPIRAVLAETSMAVEAVLGLRKGSVIPLAKSDRAPLELLVDDRILGLGTAVRVDGKLGLRLDEIISPEDTIRTLG